MSKPVTTNEVGREICDALGLPADCVMSIDLRFHAHDVVRAIVAFTPDRDQLGKVMSILRQYELHEKPSEVSVANG